MLPYDTYGPPDAPAVLLLHGAAATDTFCQQYGLATQYRLIVPHLYGAGKSAVKVYEPEAMQQEVFALLDALGIGSCVVIGHSLGAQLAIQLICAEPGRFTRAAFLSAWVNPDPAEVRQYCRLAGLSVKMLRWGWLVRFQARYWRYSAQQAAFMEQYARELTLEGYRAFFTHTLVLDDHPEYSALELPMLAVCGSKEVKSMKRSLALLGQRNPHCRTIVLSGAAHDYPMRRPEQLNPLLEHFMKEV